jgi:hypothetical protein
MRIDPIAIEEGRRRREELARAAGTLCATVFFDPGTSLHRSATPEAIKTVEAAVGIPLPPGHREFLLRSDGGEVAGVIYLPATDEKGESLARPWPHLAETPTKPILPSARTWGGDYYCYELSRPKPNGDYPVLHWDHAVADRGDPLEIWSEVAPGFLDFLAADLANPVIPAFVLTDGGAEFRVGDTRRAAIEWEQVRRIAVEVVTDNEDYFYAEAFWQLTGPGVEFRAPVGLARRAEQFESRLLNIPGFDMAAYRRCREAAAARVEPVELVCWSAEDGLESPANSTNQPP